MLLVGDQHMLIVVVLDDFFTHDRVDEALCPADQISGVTAQAATICREMQRNAALADDLVTLAEHGDSDVSLCAPGVLTQLCPVHFVAPVLRWNFVVYCDLAHPVTTTST